MPRRKPFRLPEQVVTFEFDDGPYQGLLVDASLRAPMAVFWRLAALEDPEQADNLTTEQVREFMLLFGAQIRGWNIEGVEPTPEAFADQLDQQTQAVLLAKWLQAVRKPPVPLSQGRRKPPTSESL